MDVLSEDISSVVADASQLTTKCVYDWRLKDFKDQSGAISKRWLRRSRLVAREFAFLEKRSDTYAPATSTHILNLLPVLYLQKLNDLSALEDTTQKSKVILGTIDVKDAFLVVEQPYPMVVTLLGKKYWVRKNLPGQRLGAKSWYWHLRHFLSQSMDFRFCIERPALQRMITVQSWCTWMKFCFAVMLVTGTTYFSRSLQKLSKSAILSWVMLAPRFLSSRGPSSAWTMDWRLSLEQVQPR